MSNNNLYGTSLSLLTDLYQLTMAYGYWKNGMHETPAAFHLYFRRNPFSGGYTIAAGLEAVIDWLEGFKFDQSDLDFLSDLRGNNGQVLFDEDFLTYLAEFKFGCDIDAIPEGTAVFPNEPLIRVRGPILQGQIIETPLLNLINFQTLIATKSARICQATQGEPVLEFGLRRAQGIDGSLAASRSAYIGGCAATSNVLAGKLYGIPVKGTHAHSWVMSFGGEAEAFRKYADALPNNCVFLVDTYDTLDGVRKAIEEGKRLRAEGHEMVGIRLDSGDLAALSIEARRLLDEAGFPNAAIVASNDLDEFLVQDLKADGARINVWGIGTKLVTAYDQPALGGVYKLASIDNGDGWEPRIKLSEEKLKVSTPGTLQVRRFRRDEEFAGDMIYDIASPPGETIVGETLRLDVSGLPFDDLLQPVYRAGELVYKKPMLSEIRDMAQRQLQRLPADVKNLRAAEFYPTGLDENLHDLRERLIHECEVDVSPDTSGDEP